MNSNTISNSFQGSDANNDFSDSLVKESVVGLINFTCDQRGAPSNQIIKKPMSMFDKRFYMENYRHLYLGSHSKMC